MAVHSNHTRGFTLIEVLIVLSIVLILLSVSIQRWVATGSKQKMVSVTRNTLGFVQKYEDKAYNAQHTCTITQVFTGYLVSVRDDTILQISQICDNHEEVVDTLSTPVGMAYILPTPVTLPTRITAINNIPSPITLKVQSANDTMLIYLMPGGTSYIQ